MRLSHSRQVLLGVALFLLTPACPAVGTPSAPRLEPSAAIAKIMHVFVNGEERLVAEAEARVTRAAGKRVEPANSGTLLYADDLVATGNKVKIIIRSLDLPGENDPRVILYPNTQVKIVDNNSYAIILGKAWFGLKGVFSVRTFYWILGARGTEFEVEVGGDNTALLTVLDGVVAGNETNPADKGESPVAKPPIEVKALEEIILSTPQVRAKPTPLTVERLGSILEATNEAILGGQPKHPARRVFPNFRSPSERSVVFKKARFDALWRQDPAGFGDLGDVYSDWGEGAKSLEAYAKAWRLNPSLSNSAHLWTGIAESYRLLGQLGNAESSITKALNIDRSEPGVQNALGNLFLAKARAAQSNRDLKTAKKLFLSAISAYETSAELITKSSHIRLGDDLIQKGNSSSHHTRAEQSDQSHGVAMVNIGDVKLLLGDIAQEESAIEEAAQLYEEAEEAYRQAKRLYPDYPYAESGLARLRESRRTLAIKEGVRLDLTIPRNARLSSGISTGVSLAAVASYVGNLDVAPCEMLGLLHAPLHCCADTAEACKKADLIDSNRIAPAFRELKIYADLVGPLEYQDIVRSIAAGAPVVVLSGDRRAIVISGYYGADGLITIDPLFGFRRMSYGSLIARGWFWTVRFPAPRLVAVSDAMMRKRTNEIVELLLQDSYGSPARIDTPTRDLVDQNRKFTERLGPLLALGAPRITQLSHGYYVSAKLFYPQATMVLVLRLDPAGRLQTGAIRSN